MGGCSCINYNNNYHYDYYHHHYYYYNARTNSNWKFILHSASDIQDTALQCPLDNRLSRWSGRTLSARWKGTQIDAPAGLLRPTLLEEPPPNLAPRLLALALQLLAPIPDLHVELLEPRRADGSKAAFARPEGDGHDAAGLEDVGSGVRPKPWVRFGPTWERLSAARRNGAPGSSAEQAQRGAAWSSTAQHGAARTGSSEEQRGAACRP